MLEYSKVYTARTQRYTVPCSSTSSTRNKTKNLYSKSHPFIMPTVKVLFGSSLVFLLQFIGLESCAIFYSVPVHVVCLSSMWKIVLFPSVPAPPCVVMFCMQSCAVPSPPCM